MARGAQNKTSGRGMGLSDFTSVTLQEDADGAGWSRDPFAATIVSFHRIPRPKAQVRLAGGIRHHHRMGADRREMVAGQESCGGPETPSCADHGGTSPLAHHRGFPGLRPSRARLARPRRAQGSRQDRSGFPADRRLPCQKGAADRPAVLPGPPGALWQALGCGMGGAACLGLEKPV